MRKFLLLSVSLPTFAFASATMAQVEINTETTDPVDTQTIDNGNPADIVILSAGTVLVGEGLAAVTLNSDNTVTNQGIIGSDDADNSTGVLVSGAVTGEILNSGSISLTENFSGEDTDGDGDLDTPFATGTGRVGILVSGGSTLTGNITNDDLGRITIEGNDSAGVQVAGTLNGNLTSQGTIDVTGDRTYGVLVSGTVNGDVVTAGRISATGEDSGGVRVTGEVNGAIRNTASIAATGFRSINRASAEVRAALDNDDLLIGGSAIAVGGNVTGGIINDAVTDENNNTVTGELRSTGSAPALLVAASLDGNDNGDVNIGAVGTLADDEFFGIINRGRIASAGINDGIATTGIRVEGTEVNGVLRQTIIEGGLLTTGSISADAFEADSSAVSIGNGAVVPVIDIRGITQVTTLSQSGGRAASILIESGAQVNEIRVNAMVRASYIGTGVGGFAAGIVDESGTVDLLLNNGSITTSFTELLPSGTEADPTDTTRREIAVDLSANTTGATLRQVTAVDPDPTDNVEPSIPEIEGDLLFGSGADALELLNGSIKGDVFFGDGDDILLIDNGAELTGAIYDTDGQLTMDIRDGLLALGADTALSLTSASFGANSRLQLTIDPVAGGGFQSASFIASGNVSFLEGARISPSLSGLIAQAGTFDLITAGSFSFAENFASMLDTSSLPFLYNVGISQAGGPNVLTITLDRRTAAELGMTINQAAAYDAWFDAVITSPDTALTSAFAGLTSATDFYAAYNQLLPEFGAAALQFTLANTDGTTGAIGNRLDALRRGYGSGGAWIQEIGYYLNRNRSSISQPYNGFGLGLAVGTDRPMVGFDAVGLSLSGFSSEIQEADGFDTPLSSISAQIGIYAGKSFGGLDFITHSAIGLDSFTSERNLELGTVVRTANASWRGYHIASTTKLSKDFALGRWIFSPSASFDYLRLTEEGYKEAGGGVGFDLALDSRVSENISATAAFTLGRKFGSARSWWTPRLRAGVRNDIKGDPTLTTARFVGFNDRFTVSPQALPKTALLAGFSLTAGSKYTSFGFDYDADIRNGFIRHTGKVVIRFIF